MRITHLLQLWICIYGFTYDVVHPTESTPAFLAIYALFGVRAFYFIARSLFR